MSHIRPRSRSPKERRRSSYTRENWRTRQERPTEENYFKRRGDYRYGRGGYQRRRSDSEVLKSSKEQLLTKSEDQIDKSDSSHDPSRDNPPETDGYRGRGRFGGRRFRGNPRRISIEDKEVVKQIILNPTDVPKADRYFSHDDRLGGQNGRSFRRSRIDSTPAKWGHDMFDKITNDGEEEETPPPDDNEGNQEQKTRSVVSKVITVSSPETLYDPLSQSSFPL